MLFEKIMRAIYKKKWRRLNSDNETDLSYPTNMDLVKVGKHTYGFINIDSYNDNNHLIIGRFCSIGPNVIFILSADHRVDVLSTYPFKVKICGDKYEATSKGDIVVGDDVWIGYGATIMSGVHIGQGAVIAACSVVTADVEPYSIVGGVPARLIKKRFSEDIIEEMLKIDFSALSDEVIRSHINELYIKIEEISDLDWIPKKEQIQV